MQPRYQATLTQLLRCDLQRLSCKHNRTTHNSVGKCSSKTGSPRQSEKRSTFYRTFKRKLLAPKLRKSADKSLSQPWCSHSNTILRDPAAKDNNITHAAAAPSNLDAAITMRFVSSRRKPARIYAHGNARWQQSCRRSNTICNRTFKKRIELRTQERPLVAEHRGGTKTTPATTAAHRRYLSFIAGRSHFTRKNTRFRAPASSPKQSREIKHQTDASLVTARPDLVATKPSMQGSS